MASQNFTNLSQHQAKGTIDFSADTFYALLINTTVPSEANLDAWVFRSDVTDEHAVSGNYTAGGFACTATVDALDTANNRTPVTIVPAVGNGNAVFSSSTISSNGALIFRRVGADLTTPADDELVAFVDFGGTITSTNGDFNVTFSTPIYINV